MPYDLTRVPGAGQLPDVEKLLDPTPREQLPSYDPRDVDPGIAVPHVFGFQALISGSAHTYYREWYDEALRHRRRDAMAMEHDLHVQRCLDERYRGVLKFDWHLEGDNKKDATQKAVADGVAKVVKGIHRLRRMKYEMLQAVWPGRSGVQVEWEKRPMQLPVNPVTSMYPGGSSSAQTEAMTVARFEPCNGDKIGFTWDHCPMVRIAGQYADQFRQLGADVVTDNLGFSLVLRGGWRWRWLIHTSRPKDPDFEDPEAADAVHGMGVRGIVVGSWLLRMNAHVSITDALDRYGLGIVIIYYTTGNQQEKAEAEREAKRWSRKTVVLMPRQPSMQGASGIEVVDAPTAGMEILLRLMEHYQRMEEHYLIGQSMSTGADTDGSLGGSGKAKFAADTKHDILAADADDLDESLTGSDREPGLVGMVQKHTYPWSWDQFRLRHVTDVPDPEAEGKLKAVKTTFDMGVAFETDSVRRLTGMPKPEDGEEVVSLQQQQQQKVDWHQQIHANDPGVKDGLPGSKPPGANDKKPDDLGFLKNGSGGEHAKRFQDWTDWRRFYYDPNEPRVPAGQPGGGQWLGHQMTSAQFVQAHGKDYPGEASARAAHKEAVINAPWEGHKVHPSVLAEYPDLAGLMPSDPAAPLMPQGGAPQAAPPTQAAAPQPPQQAPPRSTAEAVHGAYNVLSQFHENSDGLVKMPDLYKRMAAAVPGLTVPQFHQELMRMWQAGQVELKQLNEVRSAEDPDKGIKHGDGLLYHVFIGPEKRQPGVFYGEQPRETQAHDTKRPGEFAPAGAQNRAADAKPGGGSLFDQIGLSQQTKDMWDQVWKDLGFDIPGDYDQRRPIQPRDEDEPELSPNEKAAAEKRKADAARLQGARRGGPDTTEERIRDLAPTKPQKPVAKPSLPPGQPVSKREEMMKRWSEKVKTGPVGLPDPPSGRPQREDQLHAQATPFSVATQRIGDRIKQLPPQEQQAHAKDFAAAMDDLERLRLGANEHGEALRDMEYIKLHAGLKTRLLGLAGKLGPPTAEAPEYVPHPNQRKDETTVHVDPAKMDAAWQKDKDYYIPPGGGGAEVKGRREGFEKFLEKGEPVEASRASLDDGGAVSFVDGRHRFAVLRDKKVPHVAVTVPKEHAAEFKKRFGAEENGGEGQRAAPGWLFAAQTALAVLYG